jgi:hypothetical protein
LRLRRRSGQLEIKSDRALAGLAARNPTRNICASTTPNSVTSAAKDTPPRIPRIVASCAEHGMPSASSRTAISRSFGVPRILVVIVAIVSQPSPSTIGSTAFPLSPRAEDPIAEDGQPGM